MPAGYIKIDKSLAEVQTLVASKFTAIAFASLIDDETRPPSRHKLKCVYLHATLNARKFNYFKPMKNAAKFRQTEVTSYDRFVTLGVEGTDNVILCFTKTVVESKSLLLYDDVLTPGTPVWLLCPKFHGYLKGTQNPLITTGDPLVIATRDNLYKTPPQEVGLPNYVFFDFIPTNFTVHQVMTKNLVCQGSICDAQDEGACACLCVKPKTHWALQLTLTCDELSEKNTGEEFVSITSNYLTRLFITSSIRAELLTSDNIDTFDMEDAVIALANNITSSQGWRVIGWFKPGTDEEGVSSANYVYHVSKLEPLQPLTDDQKDLMYGAMANSVNIVPDTHSVQESYATSNVQPAQPGVVNVDSSASTGAIHVVQRGTQQNDAAVNNTASLEPAEGAPAINEET